MFNLLKQKSSNSKNNIFDMSFLDNITPSSFYFWQEMTNLSGGEVISLENNILTLKSFPEYGEPSKIYKIEIKKDGDILTYEDGRDNPLSVNYVKRHFTFYNTDEEKIKFLKDIKSNMKASYDNVLKKLDFYKSEISNINNILTTLE